MAPSRSSRLAGGAPEPKDLRAFLHDCKSDWGPRDLKAALQKLAVVGVHEANELLRRAQEGCLNDDLEAAGERRFAHETVELFRLAAKTVSSSSRVDATLLRATALESKLSESNTAAKARVDAFDDLISELLGGDADVDLGAAALNKVRQNSVKSERLFAGAQADMARVAAKISHARRQRENGRYATYNADAGTTRATPPTPSTSSRSGAAPQTPPRSSNGGIPSTWQGAPRRATSKPSPRFSEEEPPRCSRADQAGFSFGHDRDSGSSASQPAQPAQPQRRRFTNSLQEAVHQQLLAAAGSSEAEKRAHVKRLLVQWHPDRNPEDVDTSTAIFQFIQQEKSALLGV